jgi:hypothetical protein
MSHKKTILLSILFLSIANSAELGLNICYGQSTELFLIKEIVEATTDWTTVSWGDEFQMVASTHVILEGEEAIQGLEVNGLDVWIAKEGFNTTKVVIEVEAIILENPTNVEILVEKGDIEYTDIQLFRYLSNETYTQFIHEIVDGIGPQQLNIDISDAFSYSPGNTIVEDTVPDLEGKVFAAYYPWYGNPIGPSGEKWHWSRVNNTEDLRSSAHYPLLGAYDSQDPDIIRTHICLAQQAGIDGFVCSWWGPDSFVDKRFNTLLSVAEEENFSIFMYYENVRSELTLDSISQELDYFLSNYGSHPAYLRDSGEPVIFVYVPSYNERDEDFWLAVRETVENIHGPITLIGDHGSRDLFNAFEAFHTYIYLGDDPGAFFNESQNRMALGGKTRSNLESIESLKNTGELFIYNKPFFVTVYPGFDTKHHKPDPSQGIFVDREGGDTYSRMWDVAIELRAHTVLITSWNEWHEGTELEPSREHGFKYLNLTRNFISEYKGVPIEVQQSNVEVSIDPFTVYNSSEGEGKIIFDVHPGSPLVLVDVKVLAVEGAKEVNLFVPYYTYYRNKTDLMDEVVIPYVGEQASINVSFSSTADDPVMWVNVQGYDLAGNEYTLYNGTLIASSSSEPEPEPEFPPLPPLPPILSNLTITPAELESGGEVTIRLGIENSDSQSFTYIVTMQIGELTLLVDVELGAYESKTVSRTITPDMVGVFNVNVDGLSGSFMVKAPPKSAEFEFSSLRIFYPGVNPPEVEAGQTVTVTVSIVAENVGELEGGHTVELKVDGEVIDSMEVTLGGGASETVLFDLTRGEGTYGVEVEGFTDSFAVNPQPSFWDKIPGFPYESILLGLVTVIIVLWLLSSRKMTE